MSDENRDMNERETYNTNDYVDEAVNGTVNSAKTAPQKDESANEADLPPLTFDEIDYKELKKLPVNEAGIKSLILNGTEKPYPVWIPTWNRGLERLERTKMFVLPVDVGTWDHCFATANEDTSFESLILSNSVCDENGSLIGMNQVKVLPAGSPVFLMKEIRKISGHFESPRY